jgi:hypothetical protein
MHLEDSPLKVLHGVDFAIGVGLLLQLIGNRIALLSEATVGIPVGEE